jgi:hypothetical protein
MRATDTGAIGLSHRMLGYVSELTKFARRDDIDRLMVAATREGALCGA